MKPRPLTTTKLLTVAVVAVSGCSTSRDTITSDPLPAGASEAPAVDPSGASRPGAMARPPVAPTLPPALPDARPSLSQEQRGELTRLERELEKVTVPAALNQPRFRALCDARR